MRLFLLTSVLRLKKFFQFAEAFFKFRRDGRRVPADNVKRGFNFALFQVLMQCFFVGLPQRLSFLRQYLM